MISMTRWSHSPVFQPAGKSTTSSGVAGQPYGEGEVCSSAMDLTPAVEGSEDGAT
jgi:hypothetical protein